MSGETPRRTFRCDDDLWAAAERVAFEEDTTVSDMLREALRERVAAASQRWP